MKQPNWTLQHGLNKRELRRYMADAIEEMDYDYHRVRELALTLKALTK
jgi:hypothetical protein